MNMILINTAFIKEQQRLGNTMPPSCGYHSNATKFFVDQHHKNFRNLLIAAMLGEEMKNKDAREAMRLLSIQITEQDRNRIAADPDHVTIPECQTNEVLDQSLDAIRGRLLNETAQMRRPQQPKIVENNCIQF
jgi:D-alanyl-D-alanine carboxypeptidase